MILILGQLKCTLGHFRNFIYTLYTLTISELKRIKNDLLSLIFNVKSCSDINLVELYSSTYTSVFYELYKHADKLDDQTYLKGVESNSGLGAFMFQCCKDEVKTKLKQHETDVNKKLKVIKEIEKLLKINNFKTKYEKKHKYNLINKLSTLKRNIDKDISFGGKKYQRQITKLKQELNGIVFKIYNSKSTQEIIKLEKDKIAKLKLINQNQTKFTKNRTLGLYSIGQAERQGNRMFNFDLTSNKVIFKPNKDTKIDIELTVCGKKRIKTLSKLQVLSKLKIIPLTVRLTKNTFTIMYDESLLSGYKINERYLKDEQKYIKDDVVKREIYIKYVQELDERKKANKVEFRYASVDLNPKYIGLCIFDSINVEQVIIHTQMFDLTRLSTSLRLSSSDVKQVKQNNKRKHEIKETWKQIFEICKHFKVLNFVVEQLVFANKVNNDKSNKELNKQTKNLWHRTLTTNLIEKYCNEIGLKLITINAAYSSFIGNMIHTDYVDPIASAIEIGRRGMVKFLKGNSIYPSMTLINQEKLLSLLDENDDTTKESWIQLYKIISRKRYRNTLSKDKVKIDKFLGNKRSKVRVVTQ